MVFAVDFGRLYLAQGELQTAADAAALAAAKALVGTANSTSDATQQWNASFDNTDAGDNRFNLRQNQILIPTNLPTSILVDYFLTRAEALAPGLSCDSPGGGSAAPSGAKYVRVQIMAQVPVLFAQFIRPGSGPTQCVTAAAVAGISSPVCTACGIDALAIVDPSAGADPSSGNFGLTPGDFYTLYLTTTQQTAPTGPSCTASTPAALDGTDTTVEYAILDHLPTGGAIDPDGTLFVLAAAGIEQTDSDTIGGNATIGGTLGTIGPEAAFGINTSLIPTTASPGQDVICGLNTRFLSDLSQAPPCDTLVGGEFVLLAPAFSQDSDLDPAGALQDYATDYAGNGRRVLTVPVVDDPSTLNVLGFQQFLIETDPNVAARGGAGLSPSTTGSNCQTGAFPAQYLGWPVPLRCSGAGGSCGVQFGAGRTVLH